MLDESAKPAKAAKAQMVSATAAKAQMVSAKAAKAVYSSCKGSDGSCTLLVSRFDCILRSPRSCTLRKLMILHSTSSVTEMFPMEPPLKKVN